MEVTRKQDEHVSEEEPTRRHISLLFVPGIDNDDPLDLDVVIPSVAAQEPLGLSGIFAVKGLFNDKVPVEDGFVEIDFRIVLTPEMTPQDILRLAYLEYEHVNDGDTCEPYQSMDVGDGVIQLADYG